MKLVLWTVVIGALIWWLMKKRTGAGNDLTAHFEEQRALQSIGAVATTANNQGNDTFPLGFMGVQPLSGIQLDPFNAYNPFMDAHTPELAFGFPSNKNEPTPY